MIIKEYKSSTKMALRPVTEPSAYPSPEKILEREGYDPKQCLFLDIETTGFSPDTSRVYLIGIAFCEGSTWNVKQMFASGNTDEEVILRSFADLAGHYSVLVHFNGDRFDIPFLLKRMEILSIDNRIQEMASVDLYRRFRLLKDFLGLTNMNQKALETFLGVEREDVYDGGALIRVYHHFCREYDEESLELLLLHNREDVEGLLSLTRLFGYTVLLEENEVREVTLTIQETASIEETSFSSGFRTGILDFTLPVPVPVPVSYTFRVDSGKADPAWHQDFRLCVKNRKGQVLFPVFEGTLYHFFPDYRNYDYLPLEDMAIHRSVSKYVDQEYRQRAKPQNCYTKKTGCFFPQLKPVFEPLFQTDYEHRQYWFEYVSDMDTEAFRQAYLEHLLQQLKPKAKSAT